MSQERLEPADWEKLPWQETPYPGVFLSLLNLKPNPQNPKIPLSTIHAIRIDPESSIPLHRHKREPEWLETFYFPATCDLEISGTLGTERVLTPLTFSIDTYEIVKFTNRNNTPLYFTSSMNPGFTGYQEIEEITE